MRTSALKALPIVTGIMLGSIWSSGQTDVNNLTLYNRFGVDTTTNRNEATVVTSLDGQIVLTYTDERGLGNLYVSRLRDNEWTLPAKLSKAENTKGWEPNQYVSADGTTLVFTSTRAGGFGGKDIYACKKMPNGEWGKAVNLGPVINTQFDEEAPFIYTDGVTLFFSSNRNKLQCCFDNFTSTLLKDSTWSDPIKVGYPVKTAEDEIRYPKPKATTDAPKKDTLEESNLFIATFLNQKKIPFTLLKGRVRTITEKILDCVKITVRTESGKLAGTYEADYLTGDYILTLPAGRKHTITYASDGYLLHTETVDTNAMEGYYQLYKEVQLSPFTTGSKVVLNTVFFFDADRTTLRPTSTQELDKLFEELAANPGMVVELSYYIESSKNSKQTTQLAEGRILTVADYFIKRGMSGERMITQKIKKTKSADVKAKPDKKDEETRAGRGERLELIIADIK